MSFATKEQSKQDNIENISGREVKMHPPANETEQRREENELNELEALLLWARAYGDSFLSALSLDIRLASASLSALLWTTILSAVLVVFLWALAMVALAAGLFFFGLSLFSSLGIVALINILLLCGCSWVRRHLIANLTFTASKILLFGKSRKMSKASCGKSLN